MRVPELNTLEAAGHRFSKIRGASKIFKTDGPPHPRGRGSNGPPPVPTAPGTLAAFWPEAGPGLTGAPSRAGHWEAKTARPRGSARLGPVPGGCS
jgi:hypothetical protein